LLYLLPEQTQGWQGRSMLLRRWYCGCLRQYVSLTTSYLSAVGGPGHSKTPSIAVNWEVFFLDTVSTTMLMLVGQKRVKIEKEYSKDLDTGDQQIQSMALNAGK
jgi:hypothetical protein